MPADFAGFRHETTLARNFRIWHEIMAPRVSCTGCPKLVEAYGSIVGAITFLLGERAGVYVGMERRRLGVASDESARPRPSQ